jgi:hypothetical protein
MKARTRSVLPTRGIKDTATSGAEMRTMIGIHTTLFFVAIDPQPI